MNSVSVLYKEGPPPTPLEEEKVSTGEGGGGMFGAASYPLMLLVLAYLLSRGSRESHGFLHGCPVTSHRY